MESIGKKFEIESLEEGNVYKISGATQEELLNFAMRVWSALDKMSYKDHLVEGVKSKLITGEELRPANVFAISFGKIKNILQVDIRNDRGDLGYINELKAAVEYAKTNS